MTMTAIQTWTGKEFDYSDLDNINLDLEDFCYPLAQICRYGGHSKFFYSVAQHSCLVRDLMLIEGESDRMQFHGLVHDFGEAFYCDLPKPMKMSLPKDIIDYYEGQEKQVVDYITKKCGHEPIASEEKQILKKYDVWALAIESKIVLQRPFRGFDYTGLDAPIHPFSDTNDWVNEYFHGDGWGTSLLGQVLTLAPKYGEPNNLETPDATHGQNITRIAC